jgi:mannose-6-phosphate isomerase-like protein (cupin superfamily)
VLLIPAGQEHYIEPVGDEVVQNIDVFTPLRSDLAHLIEWMRQDAGA